MQPLAHTAFSAQDATPVRLDTAGEVWALVISPEISWDAARAHIADDLGERAEALHGRSLRLNLGSRPLELMEVRRISTLLRDGFKAAIIGIECTPDAVHRYAEAAFKMPMIAPPVDTRPRMPLVFTGAPLAMSEEEAPEDEAVPTDLPIVDEDALAEIAETAFIDGLVTGLEETDHLIDVENTDIIELDAAIPAEAGRRVMVVEKTLRSGKTIRFAGDVMVYGDVNSGAHIEADGNIIVFGALRGLAHAGARGDARSVIISFDLGAPQLRIASHIGFTTETPEAPEVPVETQGFAKVRGDVVGGLSNLLGRGRMTPRTFNPEIAWVEGGEIRIGSYQGRLPA
jgi:septum site-determining protein MinC